jgi:hypothetical protein
MVRLVDSFRLQEKHGHLLLAEAVGHHEMAEVVERLELLGGEPGRILL